MKRTFPLLLVIALTLSLSACGGWYIPSAGESVGTNKPTDSTQNTTAVTEAATVPAEPVPDTTTPSTVPTEPSPTEPATTEPAPTEPQLQQWQMAYLDFLERAKDNHVAFALVRIDEDDVPELYLNGDCEATGDAICTYQNGQVIELRLRRAFGGSYIPGSGLVKNTNGNMGYYTTDIFKLTDSGFANIWSGLEEQEYVPPANENEDATFVSTFFIGDQAVNEEAYYAAIETVFPASQAVWLHENAVSLDAIRQLILDSAVFVD